MRRWSLLLSALIVGWLAFQQLGSADPPPPPAQTRATPSPTAPPSPPPPPAGAGRIVVGLFVSQVRSDLNASRRAAIQATWGRHFDVAFVGHGDLALPSELRGKQEGHAEVLAWAVRQSLARWPDLRWWMKAEDLTFVRPQALRRYLARFDPSEPLLLGRRLQVIGAAGGAPGAVFCSGGAGYVLSRAALDELETPRCGRLGWPNGSSGDFAVSACLRDHTPDTRDELGRERFHAYSPQRLMSGDVDSWYRRYTPWYNITGGTACCSPESLTFHYIDYGEARALADVLAHRDAFRRMPDAERRARWPKEVPELSGYSKRPGENDAMWELLLDHLDAGDPDYGDVQLPSRVPG